MIFAVSSQQFAAWILCTPLELYMAKFDYLLRALGNSKYTNLALCLIVFHVFTCILVKEEKEIPKNPKSPCFCQYLKEINTFNPHFWKTKESSYQVRCSLLLHVKHCSVENGTSLLLTWVNNIGISERVEKFTQKGGISLLGHAYLNPIRSQ